MSPRTTAARRAGRAHNMPARMITARALKAWPLPDPNDDESKEDRGRVLVIGGSAQVPGAVLLAAVAALRAGAGKLQIATVAPAALPMAIALPEAKVMSLRTATDGTILELGREVRSAAREAGAVVIGPGMDPTPASRRVAASAIEAAQGTVVLDAGALHPSAIRAFARRGRGAMVLTPHTGEMAAMLGLDEAAIVDDAEAIAREFAHAWGVVLALKGPTTYVAAPNGRMWINNAGSIGLGTSGSGDVLAGLIGGLAARGASAEQAAVWGVHLHAQAGARLSRRLGLVGFLAREISAEVPTLMQKR
jgi:ADP-dependent NAD(P)H-hydrate dehydratase